MRFDGKKVVVTGGTAGIGRAIVRAFHEAGAEVAFLGRDRERGLAVVKELLDATGRAPHFFAVDVSKTDAVDAVFKEILDSFQSLDILVNNAGITKDGLLMKMSEADWDSVLDVNAKSCYNTCRAAIRPMMRARAGKIVNVSSVIGQIGNAGQTNYAASKAAIIGFTKALAKEVASRNIQVNVVAPGFIETAMTDVLSEKEKSEITARIPLGRIGTVESVADAVLFLASSRADYITGQVLTVDGGMVM